MPSLYVRLGGQVNLPEQGRAASEPLVGAQTEMLRVGGIELPHVVVLLVGDGEADACRELFYLCLHLYGVGKTFVHGAVDCAVLQEQGIVDEEHRLVRAQGEGEPLLGGVRGGLECCYLPRMRVEQRELSSRCL